VLKFIFFRFDDEQPGSRARALFAALAFSCGVAYGMDQTEPRGASPQAVDLSGMLSLPIEVKSIGFPIEKLDNATGSVELMLASMQLSNRAQADVLTWDKGSDQARIAAFSRVAGRSGKTLVIERRNAEPFRFVDWSRAPRSDQDGDGEAFLYAGPLGNSGYHKVDAHYQHDAPGSFLLNPESGSVLFVSTGSDVVSFSKGRNKLVVMNDGLNPPFGILVAGLNARGHEIELRCQGAADRARNSRIIPFFTGWHSAGNLGFNLVLLVQQLDSGGAPRYEAVPVRFSQNGSRWRVQVPEPERFQAGAKLTCFQ